MEVKAIKEGKYVEVSEGYAIDDEGNDIFISSRSKPIRLPKKVGGTTQYLGVQYKEVWDPDDERKRDEDSGLSEYAFKRERPKFGWVNKIPDNKHVLELARIIFPKDAVTVKEAEKPDNPGEGEIDTRYSPKACAARPRIQLKDLFEKVPGGTGGALLGPKPNPQESPKGEDKSKDKPSHTADISIPPAKLELKDAFQYHFVSAFPSPNIPKELMGDILEEQSDEETSDKQPRIIWRIESELNTDGKTIQRFLRLENLSNKNVYVEYQILRLALL